VSWPAENWRAAKGGDSGGETRGCVNVNAVPPRGWPLYSRPTLYLLLPLNTSTRGWQKL